nr:immunoglobulin light chain junction region [Mus musculus]NSM00446.1 immunoglobulin light chain junction region [Mus musculus]NSM00852.1 immunoglobulin light chain junction region [Mus musculus]NSM01923.1 immunoglobulin light chain junction region [Mus musculus]NSM02668.1 immunoglobulin light chain junction region [Mus musculus]
CHQYHSYPLTF